MIRLSALLLLLMSNAALAQTTGTLNPTPSPDAPKQDVPPGGCMPIGMTASGEIVFPLQCRAIIDRERAGPAEQKAAVPGNNAPVKTETPAVSNPVIKPVETIPVPKPRHATTSDESRRAPAADDSRHAPTSEDGDDCKHFRTYNPSSGTYRDYDGKRRPCP
jgi:BA14K-like protein